MPAVKLSPLFNGQSITPTGAPASGYKIYTYVAGSSTPLATYTDSTGNVAQTNPVVLNANGFPTNGEIWLQEGLDYKFLFQDASDVLIESFDYITGVNDSGNTASQWSASGQDPTYISAASFSVSGDQTTDFHVGRRAQFTTTAGTVYGTIATSTYGSSITTVTMTMDGADVLDSGLSVVNLSILRADHSALPKRDYNVDTLGAEVVNMSGAINEARATVASHSTTADIWSASGNSIDWTGTATTTTFPAAPQAGAKRRLHCAGACSFTHSATLDIVGNANFTATAGAIVDVEAITTTTFRLVPIKDDGTPIVSGAPASASQSEMESATSTTVTVTPGRQHFHPGMPKYIGSVSSAGTLTTFYSASGTPTCTRTAAGSYTIGGCALSVGGFVMLTSKDPDRKVAPSSESGNGFAVTARDNSGNNSDAGFNFWYYGDL